MNKSISIIKGLKKQTLDDGASSETESIYSIQDKETDVARDTSDTDNEKEEINIVYTSDEAVLEEETKSQHQSSGSEIMLAAAAAICGHASNEEWFTDGDSDSSLEDSGNWICSKCKSKKSNPSFIYCAKCFQDQKEMRPPRPKRFKKKKTTSKHPSQDSGLGSSQDFDQIKLEPTAAAAAAAVAAATKRKRKISESSVSDFEVQRTKNTRIEKIECTSKSSPNLRTNSTSDLCIVCNIEEKNSVFIHGKTGHKSCCYKCAQRTWRTIKRCPVCNKKVNNICKIFAI